MASYKVLIKPSAAKELETLPRRERPRIVARIRSLASTPRPQGCERLSGADLYRVRQGAYRILYSVEDAGRVAVIVKIGHRREVYR